MEENADREKRKRDPNETILTEEKQKEKDRFGKLVFGRSTKIPRSPPREALENATRTLEELKGAEEKLNKSKTEMEQTIQELQRAVDEEGQTGETDDDEILVTDSSSSDEEGARFYTPGVDSRIKTAKKVEKTKNQYSGAGFADLINVITAKTSDFKNGRLRFTVKDSATVNKVMAELMLRYGRMERKLLVLQKDCEK